MNELPISLVLNSSVPLYEQIYTFIKTEIQAGRICYRAKLPSTRALAAHLQVSRSTVNLAYEQLLSEGYIEAVQGSGYYTAKIDQLLEIKEVIKPSYPKEDRKQVEYDIDFSPRGIDLSSFPYNTWRRISKETLNDAHKELFVSGPAQGELPLRNAIADYLYSARGVQCSVDQIIVGAGSEYLLMLLNQVIGRDSIIGMENPTYKQAYRIFKSLEHPVVPIELDGNGMRVDLLAKTNATVAYVMPSHQYPTGVIMPITRGLELLAWSKAGENRYIIEDDYDSEFRYKGKPIPSLQGADREGKVIYIGTFSKSIAPAIRISYMVLPRPLLERYYEKCGFFASTVSRIDQEILYHFIRDGYYERHLNKMRALYRAKHDRLLAALKPLNKLFEVSGENAGVHLLLTANGNVTERELIEKAKGEKVRIYGLSSYEIVENNKRPATVILGYANLSDEEIEEGTNRLIKAFKN